MRNAGGASKPLATARGRGVPGLDDQPEFGFRFHAENDTAGLTPRLSRISADWTAPYRCCTVICMASITRHISLTEEIAPYARDRRYAVPRQFCSTVRDDDLSLELEVDIEMVGDDPHCRRLEVRALDGSEITGATLRRIPVARLIGILLANAAWKVTGPATFQTGMLDSERAEFYERYASNVRRPRRGSPVSDDHLGRVAELYRAALERGDPPTQTIADEMHAARSTAARWVAQARERGHLGPSLPGRAGEAPRKEN